MSGYSVWTAGTAGGTTAASTPGTTNATGSTFVLFVSYRSVSSSWAVPTSIVDTYLNTYTLAQSVSGVANFFGAALYVCLNGAGGTTHSATATWLNACDLCSIAFIELPSLGAATVDLAPTGVSTGASQVGTVTAPTCLTSVANEPVICAYANYGDQAQTISDSGAGFSILVSQPTNSILAANGAVSLATPASSATSAADIFSWTNVDYTVALSVSIKPPSGPTINTQPVPATGTVGGTESFTVSATTSGGSLTYQWYSAPITSLYENKPGTFASIGGATSATYTTGTLSSAQNGLWYYCAVTDSNGTLNTNIVRGWVSGLPSAGKGLLLKSSWPNNFKFGSSYGHSIGIALKTFNFGETDQVGYSLWRTYLLGAQPGAPNLNVIGAAGTTAVALLLGTGVVNAIGAGASAASVVLSGASAGALVAIGAAISSAIVTAAGAGAVNAFGAATSSARAGLTGAGALTATGAGPSSARATLTGAGALVASGVAVSGATAALAGSGALNLIGAGPSSGRATLLGAGALTAVGAAPSAAQVTVMGAGALVVTGAAASSASVVINGISSGSIFASGAGASTGRATITGVGAMIAVGAAMSSAIVSVTAPIAAAANGASASAGVVTLTGSGALIAIGAAHSAASVTVTATAPMFARGASASAAHVVVAGASPGPLSARGAGITTAFVNLTDGTIRPNPCLTVTLPSRAFQVTLPSRSFTAYFEC